MDYYVLAVALITWGGLFIYLVRLELIVRSLERRAAQFQPTHETPAGEHGTS